MSPTYSELEQAVIEWAKARAIIPNSSAQAQFMKSISELGELADAMAALGARQICDAIGDIQVYLINANALLGGKTVKQCLNDAPALTPADDPMTELVRLVGVFGRLSDAIMKGEPHEALVGIAMRRLSEIAGSYSLTLRGCLEVAYSEIKNRRGFMTPSGVFVKEE